MEAFSTAMGGKPLLPLSKLVMANSNILQTHSISMSSFLDFVQRIENDYSYPYLLLLQQKQKLAPLEKPEKKNEGEMFSHPYHSSTHAADTLQAVYCMLEWKDCAAKVILGNLGVFGLQFSAIIHDFQHYGVSNNFLVNTRSKLALTHNDSSVLERHHIHSAFNVAHKVGLFDNMAENRAAYRSFREFVIQAVLATDLSQNMKILNRFKSVFPDRESLRENNVNIYLFGSMLLKVADISHPARALKVHKYWSDNILQEMYAQGDEELRLGLKVSSLCDRNNTKVNESQIGFIDFITRPLMNVVSHRLNNIFDAEWGTRLDVSYQHWKDMR